MSIKQILRSIPHRLKKVVKRVTSHSKKTTHFGVPNWLSIGTSSDGKKRVYYFKLRFPRKLLLAYLHCRRFYIRHRLFSRVCAIVIVLVILLSIYMQIHEGKRSTEKVQVEEAVTKLIGQPVKEIAPFITPDQKGGFSFNKEYAPAVGVAGQSYGPKFTASFGNASTGMVSAEDPVSKVGITLTPHYSVEAPQKLDNRIVYPLVGKVASVIYSLKSSGIKEDLVLSKPQGDSMSFDYQLGLDPNTEAHVEKNGALGVYGVANALLGNVTTGSDSDAKLLDKVRTNAPKNNLLFVIPAPFINAADHKTGHSKAWFTLKGKMLTVHASGLTSAAYPLSIDPSIYIESAAKLELGNNETNVSFDTTNDLIQKSQTTGARINAWTSGMALPNATWDSATTVAGGYIYSIGGQQLVSTGATYATGSSTTFNVPAGISSIIVKAWGAGGGGGAGSGSTGAGGAGGGGGFSEAKITTIPGEVLTVEVGTAGAKASANNRAGNGGGYSSLKRTATYLIQAGGGGGGGGANGTTSGGAGGAGGGANGVAGTNGSSGSGGGGGTAGVAGTAGTAGVGGVIGIAGAANAGGNGGSATASCATTTSGTGGNGGTGGGGGGGAAPSTCANGGGGGGGRAGGGGGGSASNAGNRGGNGGGGGSDLVTGTTMAETAGSGTTPGNNGDSDRGTAGTGGAGNTAFGTAVAGNDGKVVIYYYTTVPSVNWAHFNTTTGAIEATNPGAGACATWCSSSSTTYDLPAALHGFSLVAYSGYLYAFGGLDSSNTLKNTVYIAKLGANGEPALWHPSGGTPVFWYPDTVLSSSRGFTAALAYNNRMYIMGGCTANCYTATPTTITTVEKADINPNGVLVGWTATGMQALPQSRYQHAVQIYNDVAYLIGGNSGGTLQNNVYYSKLNSDGTMNNWTQTNGLASVGARATLGGSFVTIYGAYIYLAGGCTAYTSGNCSTVASDVWLASINADGSLGAWNQVLGLSNQRVGYSLISWQNSLYRIGGCTAIVTGNSDCDPSSVLSSTDYGNINGAGDASTVATSVSSGTAPCSGATPTSCDLPGASVGNVLNETAIVNGYLYIMGGCTNNACGTVSTGVTYQAIASDGTLQKPASCTGSYTDSYCVSSNPLTVGLAASATAVFGSRIFIIGGFGNAVPGDGQNIYSTLVNNDGSIGAWSAATSINTVTGGNSTTLTYSYAFARANPASANTSPGNLYIFGGCTDGSVGCSGYSDAVYKCLISTAGVVSACSKTGQLQIGTLPTQTGGTPSGAGLGAMAGAVYANYVYLIGGLSPSVADLKTARYAKIDNTNNIVTVGAGWVEGSNITVTGRRRGAGFGYNGYLYVVGGYDGTSGVLADIEFAKLNVSDGSWGTFSVSSVSINQRWGLSVPVSNSYAYVIGGCTAGAAPASCTTRTNSLQTFQIYNNDSGTLASFTPASSDTFAASTDRWGSSAAVLNGYLYVAGGCTSTTDCTTAVSDVEYAPISTADGSLGAWLSATNALPAVRTWGKLVTVGGYLYYLGGQDSTSTNEQSSIYYVGTFSSGNISAAWSSIATGGAGDIGDVATAGIQSAPRTKFGVAVWDSRIYILGGLDASSAVTNSVYISPQLKTGGTITADSWALSGNTINIARFGGAATAYANNLYTFGGNNGTNYLNDGQYATIGYKLGTISQTLTSVTGSGTGWTSAQIGSQLQYPDGSTANITAVPNSTTLTVDVSKTVSAGTAYTIADGSVSSWTYTTSLPNQNSQGDAFAANGYMYVIGGRSATSTCPPNVLISPISANTTLATNNNPTGVGEWYKTNTRYAGGRYGAAVAYSSGKMYIVGGGCTTPQQGSYSTGTITEATTTVTGAGTTWSDNYVGATITYQDASTGTVVSVTDASHLVVAASKTIGSGQTYSLTMPRHQYGIVKSQPQVAKYSRMIDTDTDVFPTGFLINGLDNSTAARWQTQYRSMHDINPLVVGGSDSVKYTDGTITQSTTTVSGVGTVWTAALVGSTLVYADNSTATISSVNVPLQTMVVSVSKTIATAQTYTIYTLQETPNEDCGTSSSMATMTTWGQNTNFGSTPLGTVETYSPLNGTGGTTNCARYFYMSFSIDSSQSFGYPEDVTRGPTISDLSLLFTSDPSKRLRHGKTFASGVLQPLDTPCRIGTATPGGSQPNCPLP